MLDISNLKFFFFFLSIKSVLLIRRRGGCGDSFASVLHGKTTMSYLCHLVLLSRAVDHTHVYCLFQGSLPQPIPWCLRHCSFIIRWLVFILTRFCSSSVFVPYHLPFPIKLKINLFLKQTNKQKTIHPPNQPTNQPTHHPSIVLRGNLIMLNLLVKLKRIHLFEHSVVKVSLSPLSS